MKLWHYFIFSTSAKVNIYEGPIPNWLKTQVIQITYIFFITSYHIMDRDNMYVQIQHTQLTLPYYNYFIHQRRLLSLKFLSTSKVKPDRYLYDFFF